MDIKDPDEIIDKELLSLILGEEVLRIDSLDVALSDDIYYTIKSTDYTENIPLDTLGRLCKDWLFKKDFRAISGRSVEDICRFMCTLFSIKEHYCITLMDDTELEAIIKAVKWIAKEKGLL